MKKPLLIIITIATILIAGCKKSNNNPAPASSDSYLPVTSGTTWTYLDDVNGSSETNTTKMTGSTATFNGKTYYGMSQVSPSRGTKTGYFYTANHSYALRASSTTINGLTIEIQLGNDQQAAGYIWTTTPTDNGVIQGVPARTVNTIKEKGISKKVSGNNYTNVIHTQVSLQYDLGAGYEEYALYDIYLAKGVGMIELDTAIPGGYVEKQTLTSYTIK